MDDVPERPDDQVTRTDRGMPRLEPSGPSTDRIRIVGAEPAGEVTSIIPAVTKDATEEEDEGTEAARKRPSLLDEDDEATGQQSVHLTAEPGGADDEGRAVNPVAPGQTAVPSTGALPTELPHWTEPPTGQVPAVLARDPDDEPGSVIGGPSWREEDADWVAHEDEFQPSMLGDESVALGSLDESDSFGLDRRPWEFDLDSPSLPTGMGRRPAGDPEVSVEPESPITEPVEAVRPSTGEAAFSDAGRDAPDPDDVLFASRRVVDRETVKPADVTARSWDPKDPPGGLTDVPPGGSLDEVRPDTEGRPTEAGSRRSPAEPPVDPEPDGPAEEFFDTTKQRPTGTPRIGRARRNGLIPSRLRAKRPEETELPTNTPLAAKPPGAAVTEVPGVARRRGGLAGLAAADREAADATALESNGPPVVGDAVDLTATAAVAAGVAPRRTRRGSPAESSPAEDRADRGSPKGGPPPPRPARGREPGRVARHGTSSMGLRIGTGLAAAVVALVAFKLGTVPSIVLCTIVVTFAAGECFSVLRRAGYHPATLLGLVGTIALMVGAYTKGVAALPLVLIMITAFTFIWYLCGIENGPPVAGAAATLLTVGWITLLGGYAGLLLAPSIFPDRHGIAFLLGAIIATVANDVGALVVGGWLGRHPLAPSVSPNKTWEGLVGGTVLTIVVSALVVGSIHPWTPSKAALLGVVVSIVAPLGDLSESLLKRDLHLKDMGTLLPGHGGVLDRVDAMLFVLPATYYLVRALNLG